MANIRRSPGALDRQNTIPYEEFTPPAGWTEDENCHYLLVDLPDFKMEEVELQPDKHGHLLVSGERQRAENKFIRFKLTIKVPESADLGKISGRFEGKLLHVTVPKQVTMRNQEEHGINGTTNRVEEEKKHEEPNKDESDNDNTKQKNGQDYDSERSEHEEGPCNKRRENCRHEAGLLKNLIGKLCKNKGMLAAALLALSLGVWVAMKFQSNGVGGHIATFNISVV